MAEIVALSHEIGKDIADTLRIPVYFYEHSALMRAPHKPGGYPQGRFRGAEEERACRGPPAGSGSGGGSSNGWSSGRRRSRSADCIQRESGDTRHGHCPRDCLEIRKLRDRGEGMPGVKAIAVYLQVSRHRAGLDQHHFARPDIDLRRVRVRRERGQGAGRGGAGIRAYRRDPRGLSHRRRTVLNEAPRPQRKTDSGSLDEVILMDPESVEECSSRGCTNSSRGRVCSLARKVEPLHAIVAPVSSHAAHTAPRAARTCAGSSCSARPRHPRSA